MSEEKVIGEIVKSCAETIKVSVLTCGLCRSVTLEVWSTPRPGDGPGLHPTGKRLTISADLLPELVGLLEKAGEAR